MMACSLTLPIHTTNIILTDAPILCDVSSVFRPSGERPFPRHRSFINGLTCAPHLFPQPLWP